MDEVCLSGMKSSSHLVDLLGVRVVAPCLASKRAGAELYTRWSHLSLFRPLSHSSHRAQAPSYAGPHVQPRLGARLTQLHQNTLLTRRNPTKRRLLAPHLCVRPHTDFRPDLPIH
jgi:hypothetical protein